MKMTSNANKESKWTKWQPIVGMYGQNDVFYKTNGRKVYVKFLRDSVKAESCCNKKANEFDIAFGIEMAYFRARNKALEKKKAEYEAIIKEINNEISDNESKIKSMINSLDA